MTIQRFENGPRMSRVVVHNDTVYLAGLTAEATVGQSVAEQTKEILGRIDNLLKQGGTDKSKLLQATIWLQDIRVVDEFNKVGRLGGGGIDAGARLHRGAAAIAGEDDRNPGDRGAVARGTRYAGNGPQARWMAGRASIASCQRFRLGYSASPISFTPCRCTSEYMVMSAIE
jgi:enamine deaminase RidA (YjgF/YER057c/UK114 family)